MFLDSLDFLKRSNIQQVRLLGGEPTTHPDFCWFLDQVSESGLPLFLFSNGLMPESSRAKLEKFDPEKLSILLTVNHPEKLSAHQQKLKALTFRRLNHAIKLSYSLQTAKPQLDFLISLIEKYDLCKSVRLGLANPSLEGNNSYLPAKDYVEAGSSIYQFYKKAHKKGIQIDFDCGFVPCMFPEEFLNIFFEKVGHSCGSIPDILPDGTAIFCYPLASANRLDFNHDDDAHILNRKLEEGMMPYRTIGIFRECSSCSLKKANLCAGGCLALAMKRIRTGSEDYKVSNSGIPAISFKNAPIENKNDKTIERFVIPYIDQPATFWQQLNEEFGPSIKAIYFPLPGNLIGSGRPLQPGKHLEEFLSLSLFPYSVLLNPLTLERPVNEIAGSIIHSLKEFQQNHELAEVTVTDLMLAKHIKDKFPAIQLTASTLMDLSKPNQVLMLEEIFDTIVPSSRIMRDLNSIKELKKAFRGRIRLLVNEACLPGCPFRVQHFHEMANCHLQNPKSLCNNLLEEMPWMRLTGAWVLPQHLYHYQGLFDEIKLAGRVTLNNPGTYRRVLDAYIHKKKLMPHEIGGGPASVLDPIDIDDNFFEKTLYCNHYCHTCTICKDYFEKSRIA